MENYDEDLNNNPFLTFLRENYALLYEEAVKKNWIVCIPSASSLPPKHQFDENYVRKHLIRQDGGFARNLADDAVDWLGEGSLMRLGASAVLQILFRETFYTQSGRVSALCVRPQSENPVLKTQNPSAIQKRLTRDGVKQVRNLLKVSEENNLEIEECLGKVSAHLDSYEDSRISNCVLHNVHNQIMDLTTLLASKNDQLLNKSRKNLWECSDEDLNLPQIYLPCLDKAQTVLSELPERKTASEKIEVLRKTVKSLTETQIPTELNADDLLSLLSYLIIRSNVTNWSAQLDFIRRFHHSKQYGEDAYLLSTLEASLDHIKSIEIQPKTIIRDSTELFNLACNGDAVALQELLTRSKFKCHPLCSCGACGLPAIDDPTRPDQHGFTALHYACIYGNTDGTEVLLRCAFQNNTGEKDAQGRTALHWAASKGFQTCLLLVCHQKNCDLNAVDDRGETALHLAVRNGHESCVKALLYYSEQAHFKLDLNKKDGDGETALHLAARWGYTTIVQLLIQWEADPRISNRKKQRACDVAQNIVIARLLQQSGMSLEEGGGGRFWTGITRQLSLRRSKPQLI